ncbi:hypothetical protein J6590_030568, partial [Homalodisca vitripennis]
EQLIRFRHLINRTLSVLAGVCHQPYDTVTAATPDQIMTCVTHACRAGPRHVYRLAVIHT